MEAGVVDEDIDGAVAGDDGFDGTGPVGGVGDVEGSEVAAVGEFGGEGLGVFAILSDAEVDGGGFVVFQEVSSDSEAEAAVSAGDENVAHGRASLVRHGWSSCGGCGLFGNP